MLADRDVLVAEVRTQELGRFGRGGVLRIGVLRVDVEEPRPVRHGVDARRHLGVAHLEPGVGDIDDRAPADFALNAHRVVVALGRLGVALDAEDVARAIRERALRAGGEERVHGPVDDARRILRRWVPRHRIQAVRVDVRVVVQPDARVHAPSCESPVRSQASPRRGSGSIPWLSRKPFG